ncbi:hypothetical protein FACS1894113_3830 [Alphaproteobacteria bacterium]|nr:hypothetical protein FACS1894113_3830 [Alphaproteobacteria bacterium]
MSNLQFEYLLIIILIKGANMNFRAYGIVATKSVDICEIPMPSSENIIGMLDIIPMKIMPPIDELARI